MNETKTKPARQIGFTIVEALVSLLIISMLCATAFPLLVSAKRKLQTGSAVGKLKQFYLALELYRAENGGVESVRDYRSWYAVGFPPSKIPGYFYFEGFHGTETWRTPCALDPPDQVICGSGRYPGVCGLIRYVAPLYEPTLLEIEPWESNGNRSEYLDYLATFEQNVVVAVDPECNPPGTSMTAPFLKKRGLALLLSGQVINKVSTGDASTLRWFSSPPER